MDTAQPELEYGIGRLDQPHVIKLNTVYELPWGPGRPWLNSGGVASHVFGGWRIAAVQSYSSGLPIRVTTSAAPLPIFNGTNRPNVTGEDWLGQTWAATSIRTWTGTSTVRRSLHPSELWGTRRASTAMCGGRGT